MSDFIFKKNYYVEASAGTGKTYTIVELVNKFVREEGLDLSKILIVTYTEKAAGELKNRIRNKLSDISQEEASIYTIHSFCQTAMKEFPIASNRPSNLSVIDEDEITRFIKKYLRDELKSEIVFLKSKFDKLNIDSLIEKIKRVIDNYYLDKDGRICEDIVNLEKSFCSYEKIKRLMTISSFKELESSYSDIIEKLNILKHSDIAKANDFYDEFVESFDSLKFNFSGAKYKITAFKKYFAENEAFLAIKKYKDLLKDEKSIIKTFIERYIDDIYLAWQKEKENNKVQTFNDMLKYVREEVVNGGAFKKKLQEKYVYAIIDEFQDTNQKQWDIFKSIFLEDENHHIIVVGDPKQSIYSFQGADVFVYNKAKDEIKEKGGLSFPLTTNYRSSKDMIELCNKIFYSDEYFPSFNKSSSPENNKRSIYYRGVKEKPLSIITSEEGWISEENFAKAAVQEIVKYCKIDDYGNTMLRLTKNKDSEELRNVTFGDFTILARNRYEMEPIEKELKKAGIPYVKSKDISLFSTRECYHWICLLDAINQEDFTGNNRGKFKKALFTKFFDKSLEEINSEKYDRDDIVEIELINKWRLLAKERMWDIFVDTIIIDSDLEKKLSSLKDILSLAKFRQIGDYISNYLSNDRSLTDVINDLSYKRQGVSSDDDDESIGKIAKGTNIDCVKIMTIHTSKGLQFPVVICAGKFSVKNKSVGIYHKTLKEKQLAYITLDENCKECKTETIDELKRLYYVAYTRAEYLMILPCYKIADENDFLNKRINRFVIENKDDFNNIVYEDIPRKILIKDVKDIIKNSLIKTKDASTISEQNKKIQEMILQKKHKITYKHSYSSLSHSKNTALEIVIDDKIINNLEGEQIYGNLKKWDSSGIFVNGLYKDIGSTTLSLDYPKGAALGTFLHEVMEKIDFNLPSDERLVDIISDLFKKNGFMPKEEWTLDTISIIKNVVSSKIPVVCKNADNEEYFSLKDVSLKNRKSEIEFNFNMLGEYLKNYCNGFIDLIFKRGEYYSIVDWKSDQLNDEDLTSYSNIESLKLHTDNLYSVQRVLYSYCLIKWLKQIYKEETEEQIFNNHFGGIYYVYLRGCISQTSNGVYSHTWKCYKDLEDAYKLIESNLVRGKTYEL